MGLRRVRGVRTSLPQNTVVGRRSGGKGAAELVDLADLARDLQTYGPAATGGSVGLPTGGLAGQVLAIVAGVATWTYTTAITAVGTIATGVWQGTKIALAYGGTNADLSATGGTSKVLKQTSVGAAITVAQLAASDLSNGTTGSGAVVLAAGPTLSGVPAAPTAAPGTNTTQLATTAFVTTAVGTPGTVTSVAMTVPAELSVSGSPVTTTGTLAVTWAAQADNKILANITGGSSVPSFSTVTAVLDHTLGNTNDKFAVRTSGTWTQGQIATYLTAGTGVTLSGTTNVTINASGSTTTNVQPYWPAPRLGNARGDLWGDAGDFSNDGGFGTGPVGSGPVSGVTIQWNTPRQQGHHKTYDGGRWIGSNIFNFNTSGPVEVPFSPRSIQISGADGGSTGVGVRGYGANAVFFGQRADGTNAAKTGLVADDIIFVLGGAGYHSGGAYTTTLKAQMRFNATETWSSTAQGTYISFLTTTVGTTTTAESARIRSSGCWFLGTNTNDTAAAGVVGEVVSSNVLTASAVSLVSATAKDITTISLTAGDWEVSGVLAFKAGATTTITQQIVALNTVTNTLPTLDPSTPLEQQSGSAVTGTGSIMGTGTAYVSLSGPATYRLIAQSTFATSTMAAYGYIYARRMR